MSASTPEPGEVWQDPEGTCLAKGHDDDWFVFGRTEPFDITAVLDRWKPERRLLTATCEIAPERL
jgi:hypothetical protein